MAVNGRPTWNVERPYRDEDVNRLRGTVAVEHTLAKLGAERLRELLSGDGYVRALGASTGNQAVQQVQAGLEAVYVSGWQVAGDANQAGQMGGKVLLPPPWPVRNLVAARLAADVERVPTVVIARTDALDADLLVSNVDEADREFVTGERTDEG